MAYADYTFYINGFHGDTLAGDSAGKWLEQASDELDAMTFGRLMTAFPKIEAHVIKVQKAVCAVAEALYCIDGFRKAAAAQKDASGNWRGAVASQSAGSESVSYSTGNTASSAFAAAAADEASRRELLRSIAAVYLSNIPDAEGVNLLYAGIG